MLLKSHSNHLLICLQIVSSGLFIIDFPGCKPAHTSHHPFIPPKKQQQINKTKKCQTTALFDQSISAHTCVLGQVKSSSKWHGQAVTVALLDCAWKSTE